MVRILLVWVPLVEVSLGELVFLMVVVVEQGELDLVVEVPVVLELVKELVGELAPVLEQVLELESE
jgi:hypothetical protein